MTEHEQIERVRRKLDGFLMIAYRTGLKGEPLDTRELATGILNEIEGLLIEHPDQSLPIPRYPHSEIDSYIYEGQEDMLKSGFVRVINKEKVNGQRRTH
jgi:hypothetical protein